MQVQGSSLSLFKILIFCASSNLCINFDFWKTAFISFTLLSFFDAPLNFVQDTSETFPSPLSWSCKPHIKTYTFQWICIVFIVKDINILFFLMLRQPKINPRHREMLCPTVQRERHLTLMSKEGKDSTSYFPNGSDLTYTVSTQRGTGINNSRRAIFR